MKVEACKKFQRNLRTLYARFYFMEREIQALEENENEEIFQRSNYIY